MAYHEFHHYHNIHVFSDWKEMVKHPEVVACWGGQLILRRLLKLKRIFKTQSQLYCKHQWLTLDWSRVNWLTFPNMPQSVNRCIRASWHSAMHQLTLDRVAIKMLIKCQPNVGLVSIEILIVLIKTTINCWSNKGDWGINGHSVHMIQLLLNTNPSAGLSLTIKTPVASLCTPIANLWLCGWILLTGNFTCSIMGKSSILSINRCYRLWPLMTALKYYFKIISPHLHLKCKRHTYLIRHFLKNQWD